MSDERDTLDGGSTGNRRNDADANGSSESSVARPTGKRTSRRTRDDGSVAVAPRSSSAGSDADKKTQSAKKSANTEGRGNPFKRLRKFLREVVAELRKVIWPNRKQMITYTSVVLVFVVVMVAFIGGLDVAFIKGVEWLFG
ncbi:preprotein translocase subunit SecE [Aldersonia kunmingensis]|uniref:preprotein translocase subunit SecE n=1 Tax=Aldersonia kunmingensis TaxID=408066 RepID=UPI00082DA251|nr:preprotein translocase subunit SecE [Aldersonia kunmingensis]